MRETWVIAKKEFKRYFQTPIAYVVIIDFLLITGWLFFDGFFRGEHLDINGFFNLLPWILLFVAPAISMSLIAEEKRMGTIELLLTLPVTNMQVIFGKFLASCMFLYIGIGITMIYPITISIGIGALEFGTVLGGYVAILFLGAAYLSIGFIMSILTKDQIVAWILGTSICFFLYILGDINMLGLFPDSMVSVIEYLSISYHFKSIARGVFDIKDIVYCISIIYISLYIAKIILDNRKKIVL